MGRGNRSLVNNNTMGYMQKENGGFELSKPHRAPRQGERDGQIARRNTWLSNPGIEHFHDIFRIS